MKNLILGGVLLICLNQNCLADELTDRLDDLQNEISWNSAIMLSANAPTRALPARDDRPEWQRTGCPTTIEFRNGEPYSVCIKGVSHE